MSPIDYAAAPTELAAQMTWWTPTDAAQFLLAALGLLLAVFALPRALASSVRTLRSLPNFRWLLLALALALALRLLVPARLVMVFSGYELVERSAVLTHVHRYGAGSQVLHRLLFTFLPPHHATLIALHRIAGWLALWPLLAWFARWRPPPLAVTIAAFGLATLPLLVQDAATESILVVGALWLWSGLFLLDHDGPSWRPVVLLAAAAMTRPELAIVAPLLAFLILRYRGTRPRLLHLLLFALLVAPQAWHMVERLQYDAGQGQHRLGKLLPWGPFSLIGNFLPFWALEFPLAWTLLALWGQRLSVAQVHWRRWLLLATVVWAFFLQVDLGPASIVRLQAPLVTLWLVLGAWQLAELQIRWQWLAGTAIVLTTMIPGFLQRPSPDMPTMLGPKISNEDVSEAVIADSLALLPPHDACLVTLHETDPPDKGKVQRAFPDYLLRLPFREVKRYGMRDWQENGAPQCKAGTFLLIDHRCYAIFHHANRDPNMLPICSETLANHSWQSRRVVERHNAGQNAYGWYPDVSAFRLGLYRLGK
jgi:hypothetical protein